MPVTARQVRLQLLQAMPRLLERAIDVALEGDNQVLTKLLQLGIPIMSMKDDPHGGTIPHMSMTNMEKFDLAVDDYYKGELTLPMVSAIGDILLKKCDVYEATELRRRLDTILAV